MLGACWQPAPKDRPGRFSVVTRHVLCLLSSPFLFFLCRPLSSSSAAQYCLQLPGGGCRCRQLPPEQWGGTRTTMGLVRCSDVDPPHPTSAGGGLIAIRSRWPPPLHILLLPTPHAIVIVVVVVVPVACRRRCQRCILPLPPPRASVVIVVVPVFLPTTGQC